MTLKRISDKVIARALEKQKMFKGKNLEDAIDEGDRLTAQAQLEADLKAHNAVITQLFEEIEKKVLVYREDEEYILAVGCYAALNYKALKQKYIGGK